MSINSAAEISWRVMVVKKTMPDECPMAELFARGVVIRLHRPLTSILVHIIRHRVHRSHATSTGGCDGCGLAISFFCYPLLLCLF